MLDLFNQDTKELKCAIYGRISTIESLNIDNAFELQLSICRKLADVKGYSIYKEYTDLGISGTIFPKNREGMSQLISDARNGQFQILIIYSLDRLGRSFKLVMDVFEYIHLLGVKIICHRETIDTTCPMGMFVVSALSALAELDRKVIVARMAEGKKERAALDGEIGGPLPYGYWRVDKKLEKNDEEAEVVRYIFDMKYKGATNKGITESLGKIGYKPPRGNKWPSSTVHKILSKRDIYVGGKRNNSQVCWPQILPRRYKYHQFVRKYKKKENVVEEVNEQARKKGINMDQFPK